MATLIDKTRMGFEPFDEAYGGIYRGRPVFCCGRRNTGKTVVAAHFLHQAYLEGDRGLMLTDWSGNDALIIAEALGVPFSRMLSTGALAMMEYTSEQFQSRGEGSPLPPEAFIELQRIIVRRSIRRVVFDTVLPWLAIRPVGNIQKYVYSFVRAMERLKVTVLITLPWPASTPSFVLKSSLEDVCPVVLSTERDQDTGEGSLNVVKYLGENLSSGKETSFPLSRGGFTRSCDVNIVSTAPAAPAAEKDEVDIDFQSNAYAWMDESDDPGDDVAAGVKVDVENGKTSAQPDGGEATPQVDATASDNLIDFSSVFKI